MAANKKPVATFKLGRIRANQLPEYEMSIERNEEGDEIVRFIHRSQLALDYPARK